MTRCGKDDKGAGRPCHLPRGGNAGERLRANAVSLESECYEGRSVPACVLLVLFVRPLFQGHKRGIDGAAFDLLCGRSFEAQLADSKAAIAARHRRPEGPAEERSRRIEIAGPVRRIEHRAGLIVGILLEEFDSLFRVAEDAGGCIAWKPGSQTLHGLLHASSHASRAFRILAGEFCKSLTQAVGVEL